MSEVHIEIVEKLEEESQHHVIHGSTLDPHKLHQFREQHLFLIRDLRCPETMVKIQVKDISQKRQGHKWVGGVNFR